jgi:hypothetical protein
MQVAVGRRKLPGCLTLASDNLALLPHPPLGCKLLRGATSLADTQVFIIEYPVVCFSLAFNKGGWFPLCAHLVPPI